MFNPKFGSASPSTISVSGVTNCGSSGLDKYKNSLKTLYNLIILIYQLSISAVSKKQLILEITGTMATGVYKIEKIKLDTVAEAGIGNMTSTVEIIINKN